MEKYSVLMSLYKKEHPEYLRLALDSMINQTVKPDEIVLVEDGPLTPEHCELLASCYRSCLNLASENGVTSIAFCCISTGVFMFPPQRAAEIAVATVQEWLEETGSGMKVVFNVFKDTDREIYDRLLNPATVTKR